MGFSATQDLALQLKTDIIVQNFRKLTPLVDGMKMQEVFKRTRNVNDRLIDIEKYTREVKSIPYVDQAAQGPALNGDTKTSTSHYVPPMKAHARVMATDLAKAMTLNKVDFNTWLQEGPLTQVRESIDYSMEWLKRSMLTTGNLSYPYFLGNSWSTAALTFGTMYDGGTAATKWDAAAKTLEQIWIDTKNVVRDAKNTTANSPFFQSPNDIKVYMTDNGFDAMFAKLNGRQNIDSVSARIVNESEININGYTYTQFPGTYINPQTGASTDAVTAKEIRIVDTSMAAQHSIAMLELDNINAMRSSNKHMLVDVIVDPYGAFVDIVFEFRPVPVFTPEASAKLITLS